MNVKLYSKTFRYVFIVWILLLFIPVTPALAWDQTLIDAANAVHKGNFTNKQLATVLSRNYDVNLLAMKGMISNDTFQSCHSIFEKVSIEIGKKVAKQVGVDFTVQAKKPGLAHKAGTDQDYITGATEPEQVKKMQLLYNEEFTKELKKLDPDISNNRNWIVENDIDFMADASKTSAENFKKIAILNNAAYTRPGSARYEAWSRSEKNGEPPNLEDSIAYIDEMQDMIHHRDELLDKFRREFDETIDKMNKMKRNTPEYAALRKRADFLDTEIFKNQALQAKYIERINVCTKNLKHWLSPDSPLHKSDSESQTSYTDMSESASGRNILDKKNSLDTRAIGVMKDEIIKHQLKEHIEVMAAIAKEHPSKISQMHSAISKYATQLDTSQKKEVLETVRKKLGQDASDSLAKVFESSIKKDSKEKTTTQVKDGEERSKTASGDEDTKVPYGEEESKVPLSEASEEGVKPQVKGGDKESKIPLGDDGEEESKRPSNNSEEETKSQVEEGKEGNKAEQTNDRDTQKTQHDDFKNKKQNDTDSRKPLSNGEKKLALLLKKVVDNPNAVKLWTGVIYQHALSIYNNPQEAIDGVNNLMGEC